MILTLSTNVLLMFCIKHVYVCVVGCCQICFLREQYNCRNQFSGAHFTNTPMTEEFGNDFIESIPEVSFVSLICIFCIVGENMLIKLLSLGTVDCFYCLLNF